MLRILLAIILPALLISCSADNDVQIQTQTQPVKPRPEREDFSKLTNDQLCELSFKRIDPYIDEEIYVRNIYCDQIDLTCRKQGFRRNSLAMLDCTYKEKLKHQSPDVKFCFDSGIGKGDIDGMTGCLIERRQTHYYQRSEL